MLPIERIKQHWADRITEVRQIAVPEWGDDDGPLLIFVKPTNLAQRGKLFKLANNDSLDAVAETLILRARKEDGTSIFAPADREALMTSCDPDVLTRVASEINSDINAASQDELEDAAKN